MNDAEQFYQRVQEQLDRSMTKMLKGMAMEQFYIFSGWDDPGYKNIEIEPYTGYIASKIADKKEEKKDVKCECGSDTVRSPCHSNWCPKA